MRPHEQLGPGPELPGDVAPNTAGGSEPSRRRAAGVPRGKRRRKARPAPSPASRWALRYALSAYFATLALDFIVAAVLSHSELKLGLGVLIIDLAMLATLVPLYRTRAFTRADLGLRPTAPPRAVGLVIASLVTYIAIAAIWAVAVIGHRVNPVPQLPRERRRNCAQRDRRRRLRPGRGGDLLPRAALPRTAKSHNRVLGSADRGAAVRCRPREHLSAQHPSDQGRVRDHRLPSLRTQRIAIPRDRAARRGRWRGVSRPRSRTARSGSPTSSTSS